VFGFAPFYLFPLPILALALLFRLLRATEAKDAFRLGWSFGLGWFLAGVSWVYVSMHTFGQMPAPLAALATVLFCAFLALFPASALVLAVRWRLGTVPRWLLAVPALWALQEWLRGWILTGFPWQALGYSQVPWSPLAGYAPILGVYGTSWLAALSAGALALLLPHTRALSRRSRTGVAAGLAIFWLAGWGLQHLPWTRPAGEPVTVNLLQGNVPQEMKFRPEKLAGILLTYQGMVLDSRARLTVLPETALPLFVDNLPAGFLEAWEAHAREIGGAVLTGIPERFADGRYYNSVLTLDGGPRQFFRKVHLVPLGEFIPPGFKWLLDLMQIPLGDFTRGDAKQPPMLAAGQRVAANVCYEDVFGEELIHALPAAGLMANVSNDAWFGHSFAPWQHLQIGQMRALETGRWWLRANNTGITAILDERGRVRARLEPFTTGNLEGTAQPRSGLTPYARWGNGGFLLLAGLALLLAGAGARGVFRNAPG